MAKEKLNTVIIGCGGHARGCNIPCVAKNPLLEMHALCDLDEDNLKRLAEKYSPKYATADMEKVISDPETEMIVCATGPSVRLQVVELAIKYNKPLFVEKPIAYTREDMLKIVDLIKESGLPFTVGFNRPFSPMMQRISEIYKERKSGNSLIHYRIVGEALIWPEFHRNNVLINKESTVIHETTHIFDLLTWMVGKPPKEVYMAGGGHIDNMITLTFDDETVAVIMAGDNGSVGYSKERIEIDTNYTTIIGDNFVEMWATGLELGQLQEKFPCEYNGKVQNLNGRECAEAWWEWRKSTDSGELEQREYREIFPHVDKGHYGQHEAFRKSIVEGYQLESDVVRGAMPNLIAECAIKSWEDNMPVKIDLSILE
ncbi:MAG: Gfo/Idh/MocA family protein [Planctomycetota bacterium]|jgi:predicted dehydrogenase